MSTPSLWDDLGADDDDSDSDAVAEIAPPPPPTVNTLTSPRKPAKQATQPKKSAALPAGDLTVGMLITHGGKQYRVHGFQYMGPDDCVELVDPAEWERLGKMAPRRLAYVKDLG